MSPRRRGRFLVIDGTDGSGKATQIQLLADRLHTNGCKVQLEDFPQYGNNAHTQLITQMLDGVFGPIQGLNPYLASVPYAFDRATATKRIQTALQRGTIVIANRFTSANLIHQAAKLDNPVHRLRFEKWVEEFEHGVLGSPKPDAVVFLDVPPEISQRLLEKREKSVGVERRKRDRSEKDIPHQAAAYKQAVRLATRRPDWHRIFCAKDGVLLTPQAVAERVWPIVRPLL